MISPHRFIATLFWCCTVWVALGQPDGTSLHLPDTLEEEIALKIELGVLPGMLEELRKIKDERIEPELFTISWNGRALDAKSLKTRGNSTRLYPRKSFSVSLREAIDLEGSPIRKLAVNNLAMDQHYCRNRLAFLLMRELELFPLKNTFAEVLINDSTQGVYLVVQKPEDYVRQREGTLLLRRENRGKIKVEYEKDSPSKAVRQLEDLTARAEGLRGKARYALLDRHLQLGPYFTWLAFNYWIGNGDYTDELFLYLPKDEKKRFEILPWDFDDIFMDYPHEGWNRRNQHFGDRLIYSSEPEWDHLIHDDDLLYNAYLQAFEGMLTRLSPDKLKLVFEQVYRELYPYFSDPRILAQSAYDLHGQTSLEKLRSDLRARYGELLDKRKELLEKIRVDRAFPGER